MLMLGLDGIIKYLQICIDCKAREKKNLTEQAESQNRRTHLIYRFFLTHNNPDTPNQH